MWILSGQLGIEANCHLSSVWLRPSRNYNAGRSVHADFTWQEKRLSRVSVQLSTSTPNNKKVDDAGSNDPTYTITLTNQIKKPIKIKCESGQTVDLTPGGEHTVVDGDSFEFKSPISSRQLSFHWRPIIMFAPNVPLKKFTLLKTKFGNIGVRLFKEKLPENYTHYVVGKFSTSPLLLLSAMKGVPICHSIYIDDLLNNTQCPKNEPNKFPLRSAHHTDETFEDECINVLHEHKAGNDLRWWKKSPWEEDFDGNQIALSFPGAENVDEQEYWSGDAWNNYPSRSTLFSNILAIDFNESQFGTNGPFKRYEIYEQIFTAGGGRYVNYDLTTSPSSPEDIVNAIVNAKKEFNSNTDTKLIIVKPTLLPNELKCKLLDASWKLEAFAYVKANDLAHMIRDGILHPKMLFSELFTTDDIKELRKSRDESKKRSYEEATDTSLTTSPSANISHAVPDIPIGTSLAPPQREIQTEAEPPRKRKLLRKAKADDDVLDDVFGSTATSSTQQPPAPATIKIIDQSVTSKAPVQHPSSSATASRVTTPSLQQVSLTKNNSIGQTTSTHPSSITNSSATIALATSKNPVALASSDKKFKLKRRHESYDVDDDADTSFGLPPAAGAHKKARTGNDSRTSIEERHRELLRKAGSDAASEGSQSKSSSPALLEEPPKKTTQPIIDVQIEDEQAELNTENNQDNMKNSDSKYLQVNSGRRKVDLDEAEFNAEFNKLKVVKPIFRKVIPPVRQRIGWQDENSRGNLGKGSSKSSAEPRSPSPSQAWTSNPAASFLNIKYFEIKRRESSVARSRAYSSGNFGNEDEIPNFKAFRRKHNRIEREMTPLTLNPVNFGSTTDMEGYAESPPSSQNSQRGKLSDRSDDEISVRTKTTKEQSKSKKSAMDEIMFSNGEDDEDNEEDFQTARSRTSATSSQRETTKSIVGLKRLGKSKANVALAPPKNHHSDSDSDSDDSITFKGFKSKRKKNY